jgi:hypothetical protein
MSPRVYIDLIDLQVGIGSIAISQRCLYGFDGLIDIQHLSVFDTVGVGPAEPEYLHLAKLILTASDHCDLGCSDVKPHNDWLLVVHDFVFLVV